MRHLITLFCLAVSYELSYESGGDDWDGECASGTLQSPVNINESEAVTVSASTGSSISLQFIPKPIKGIWNSNIFELYGDMGSLTFYISEMLSITLKSQLAQFHSPSEHTINDEKFDLEMQITMYNPNVLGQTFILALLFKVSNKENSPFISQVIKSSNEVVDINLMDAFGGFDTIGDFYEFEGSMTTYPCQENVKWIVLSDVQSLAMDQLKFFVEKWSENNTFEGMIRSDRNIQPLNKRLMLRVRRRRPSRAPTANNQAGALVFELLMIIFLLF
ncbi:unnamed protein product [Blepharisma stoltei]|uniref:carbonic anhydrase n=1 Tax=Blepharisma stoltei TaxID=1481888 RepID=A0AAU9IUT1_9CILI|nr:unnamed protein product [Blepharisma stoltei]